MKYVIQLLLLTRHCSLNISKTVTKAKSQEPTHSEALSQNKIARQGVCIQKVKQAGRQTGNVALELDWRER